MGEAGIGSPSARTAIAAVAEQFHEIRPIPIPEDPLDWPGYGERLARARAETGEAESVVAGSGRIAGNDAVLIATDFRFLAGSMGTTAGSLIVTAFREAIRTRRPIVSLVASGGARMQEGMLSLVQMQRIAAVIAEARTAGIAHICAIRDPTTGGVWASLAASADVLLALPGATVAFAGQRVRGDDPDESDPAFTSDGKSTHGFVDGILSEEEIGDAVELAVELLSGAGRREPQPARVPVALSRDGGGPTTAWDSVLRARHSRRPRAQAYLDSYFEARLPICGDRCGGVDGGMLCGFGERHGETIAYAAQTGARNTPAGYRSAARLIALADRMRLPILTLIDTPGAAHNAAAERAGVGTAIAELFQAVASCEVPITSLVIGEGGSGGALALASPDDLWIARDAYFSVIAPEGAAAILERDSGKASEIVERLALRPDDLARLGVARGVASPESGA